MSQAKNFAVQVLLYTCGGLAITYLANKMLSRGPIRGRKLPAFLKNKGFRLTKHESEIASSIVEPNSIACGFSEVGGLEHAKRELNTALCLPFHHPEFFSGGLRQAPKGVLLYGPPGTGKTLLAKAIAKESRAYFLNLQIDKLTNCYMGESEKLISAVFSLARKLKKCIIFLDEIDCILGKTRSGTHHEVYKRQVSLFLSLWDGFQSSDDEQIIVVGATNFPSNLDHAVIRRMPIRFHVKVPDEKARVHILSIILRNEKHKVDIATLASKTIQYTGADLKELAQGCHVPASGIYRKQP